MTKKGNKPTNKDRDKALMQHDAVIREIVGKFNGLYNQVQDLYAIFSMFVEYQDADEGFADYIEQKSKEVQEVQDAEKPKIVGADGNVIESSKDSSVGSTGSVEPA